MTDDFKLKADQIWQTIQKSQNILLHLHPNPDPDSAGSALAMYWMLKNLGKNPVVIKGDSEKPHWLEFLPGGPEVLAKSYPEIDTGAFDLFLILDSGSPNQITKLAEINFPLPLSTAIIDHHISNSGFAQINLIDISYPAVGQILYELFKYWQVSFSPEIAANLIASIFTDTGGFQYPPTSSQTFEAMAELSRIYPDFSSLISNLLNYNSPGFLRFLATALNNIEVSGSVALSTVSYQELQQKNIEVTDLDKSEVANMLKSVVDWTIGVSAVESEPNLVNVSFRTRDEHKYDVSKIALATGFGGGHRAAAGATLHMPIAEAKNFLLNTIYSIYPDLKP